MLRSLLLLGLVAIGAGLGACGAKNDLSRVSDTAASAGPASSSTSTATGGGGASGTAGAGGARGGAGGAGGGSGTGGVGGTGGASAVGGADGGGGMCPVTPPSPDPPLGCSENMGAGWVAVPCVCELWTQNTMPDPATATIELTLSPPDFTPTFDGPLLVQVAFEDPDTSWYTIWAAQPGNGSAYQVTTQSGTTTVTLGASDVTLPPVPLQACEMRKAWASIPEEYYACTLSMNMQAVITAGSTVTMTSGPCFNEPPT